MCLCTIIKKLSCFTYEVDRDRLVDCIDGDYIIRPYHSDSACYCVSAIAHKLTYNCLLNMSACASMPI
jgi:hypothetical protein